MNEKRMRELTKDAGHLHQVGPAPVDSIKRRARSTILRKRLIGGALATVLLSSVGAAALSTFTHGGDRSPASDVQSDLGTLSQKQYELALNAAQAQVNQQKAEVSAANATLLSERVDGNIGDCPTPSLRVQLIGKFPLISVGGEGAPTSLLVTLDPVTGATCQVGVSTGTPHLYLGATSLLSGLHAAS